MRITRLRAILELQYQIPTLRNRIRICKKMTQRQRNRRSGVGEKKKTRGAE